MAVLKISLAIVILFVICTTGASQNGTASPSGQRTPPPAVITRPSSGSNALAELMARLMNNPQLTNLTQLFGDMRQFQNMTQLFGQMQQLVMSQVTQLAPQIIRQLPQLLPQVQKMMQSIGISQNCMLDVAMYAYSLTQGKMWAIQMFDASGKPSPGLFRGANKWLGRFDQCQGISGTAQMSIVERNIGGEYCAVNLILPKSMSALLTGMAGVGLGNTGIVPSIRWDLCVPNTCSSKDLTILLDTAAKQIPNNGSADRLRIYAKCHKDGKLNFADDGISIFVTILLGFFAVLIIFCSLLDGFGFMDEPEVKSADRDNEKNGMMPGEFGGGKTLNINGQANGTVVSEEKVDVVVMTAINSRSSTIDLVPEDKESMKKDQPNTARQFVQAFSLYTNVPKLLSTRQGSGSLTCLNGIRVLSMSWVILGHTIVMLSGLGGAPPISNILGAFEKVQQFSFQSILNGTYSVDTFFLLSGLLVTYLYLQKLKKDGFKPFELGLFYFHRIWRLTPLYVMVMLCYMAYYQYLDGPISGDRWSDAENCKKYWWRNLLYINNFFKGEEMCMGVTWYLANDWQMYVIAPLVILPLFYKPVVGLIGIGSLVATHVISNAAIYQDIIHTTPAALRQGPEFDRLYIKPWARVAPFAVGMLTAYILHKTKCKLRLPKVVVVFLWLVAVGLTVLITYVQYDNGKNGKAPWGDEARTAFQTLDRLTWSVAIAWMILACCTGHGGVINSILSWPGWVPLTRLTYGAYLIHLTLMGAYLYTRRTMMLYTDYTAVYQFLGHWMLSYGGAFIFSVAFESPMMTLEKMLISTLKRIKTKK